MDNKLKKTRQSEKDNNDSFRKWLKEKRKQQRFDRKVERYKNAELVQDHVIRSQEDCNRIFNAWLRKKDKEIRHQKEEMEMRLKLQEMVLKRKREIEKMKLAQSPSRQTFYFMIYEIDTNLLQNRSTRV